MLPERAGWYWVKKDNSWEIVYFVPEDDEGGAIIYHHRKYEVKHFISRGPLRYLFEPWLDAEWIPMVFPE